METDKKKLEDLRLRVYEKFLLEFDRQGDSTDMVIFANEKLSELFDWESVLQIKKEEFEDRLSIAPKSNHQSIYNTEFSESSNQYDPEINFSLRSIAYYLIEQGLNWDMGQITRRWPILNYPRSEQRIFEEFYFPFKEKYISCFVADGEFLENSIVDGISQVHYKEYLKDRRKDFYPEEFVEQLKVENTISTSKEIEKILWKKELNKLATLFFELKERDIIETRPENLLKFLISNFADEKGKSLSESTMKTYLKPDRNESRAKKGKLDIDELFNP